MSSSPPTGGRGRRPWRRWWSGRWSSPARCRPRRRRSRPGRNRAPGAPSTSKRVPDDATRAFDWLAPQDMVMHSMGSPTWQEDHVEADGFRMRYVRAGDGAPLVHLHGGGGLALTPAHDLLARERRVIAFEMPGFGDSPENTRHQTMNDMARTMLAAVTALGIDEFDLMGTSFGGKTAVCAAVIAPERVRALVLESPAAIRPDDHQRPVPSTPEELIAMLHAHPERVPPRSLSAIGQRAKVAPLMARLMPPARDAELEA